MTNREDYSSLSAFLEENRILSPLSRASMHRAKRAHSKSPGGGLSVKAGSKSDLKTESSRWPMLRISSSTEIRPLA